MSKKNDDSNFNIYWHEIKNIPLMSAEEEYSVAWLAKQGDKEAREQLVNANLRLVVKVAKSYKGSGMDMKDLIQAGNLGLMRAAQKYDPSKGTRFSTVATWWVRQAIGRCIEENANTIRLPAHIQERSAQLYHITEEFEEHNDRSPTVAELVELSGLSELMVRNALNIPGALVSLDEPLDSDDSNSATLGELIPDYKEGMAETLYKKQCLSALYDGLNQLDRREADVLRMRYGIGCEKPMKLDEIGRAFGITRERARQLEEQALRNLRAPELMGRFIERK